MVVELSHPVDWYFVTNAHILCLFGINKKQHFVLRETKERFHFPLGTMHLSLKCSQMYSLNLKKFNSVKSLKF